MQLKKMFYFQTRKGVAVIAFSPANQRYHAVFDDEDLGNYGHPQQAVDDLCGGHTYSHSSGIDTAMLGIPEDLGDWVRAR